MNPRNLARPFLSCCALLAAASSAAGPCGLDGFRAEYEVRYLAFRGDIEMQLLARDTPGDWYYRVTTDARGLASLVRPGTATEEAWFSCADGSLLPQAYRLDDGTRAGEDDMTVDFDWQAGVATSVYEDRSVELELAPGVHDRLSTDVLVMQALRDGREPGPYVIAEKNELRDYDYRFETKETIEVPAGRFETLRYHRQRIGSSRSTRIWYAPAADYLPVRIEQLRRGETVVTTVATELEPGG